MHKNNELLQDLLQSWKKGWNNYIDFPSRDYKPIEELAKAVAFKLNVDIDTDLGYKRVLMAIPHIAAYCSRSRDWRDKNLYTINQAIQTIMQEMVAEKLAEAEVRHEKLAAEREYERSKSQRSKLEQDMWEASQKMKKEYEENWTPEDQAGYEKYMRSLQPGKVISIDLIESKRIQKAL